MGASSGQGRRRAGRILFLAAAWALLATVIRPAPPRPPPGPAAATLTATPVMLDRSDPARRRVGALVFLAGWSLASEEARFGSISAMHVEAGGIVAISDAGAVMRFAVPGGAPGVRIAALPAGPGDAARKSDRDAEALLVEGGRMWVAFERHNSVWRYGRDGRAESSARPAAMAGWGRNSGAEAMVRLADGRFLILAEGPDDDGAHSEGVLFDGDPAEPGTRAAALRYRRPPGYRATDAALLPDGRLLVLNRRFGWLSGISAMLVVVEADSIEPGATMAGRVIAELEAPLAVDNMEALSVTVEGGRTIVWIASDDNFLPLQRSLLMKFALNERARERARE